MKNQSVRVGLYRRVGRMDPSGGEYGLYQLKEDDKLFTKPTLLCCGGGSTNKTHEDGIRWANGFAKVGHSLIAFKDIIANDDPIDIVALTYPEDGKKLHHNAGKVARAVLEGDEASYSEAADHLMYDHIEPLLVDNRGKPRKMAAIKRNLRNINIVCHSYGGIFVHQLSNALYARLLELFPNREDIADIREAMAQVLVVKGGSVAPLGAGEISFTMLDMLDERDTISGQHYPDEEEDNMQPRLIEELLTANGKMHKTIPGRPANPLTVMPITLLLTPKVSLEHDPNSRQCLVYASQPTVRAKDGLLVGNREEDEGARSNVRGFFYEEETGKLPDIKDDKKHHNVPDYFHYGGGTHGFMLRTTASSALANGINNSIRNQRSGKFTPLPKPVELLKCPEKLLYPMAKFEHYSPEDDSSKIMARDFRKVANTIRYNERIAAASGQRER